MYKYLKGGCKEDGSRLFSVLFSARTRGDGHKLKHKRFPLNMRNHFSPVRVTEHWHRLSREVVESPFVEIFKSCLDGSTWPCLSRGVGPDDFQRSLPTSSIL